MDIFETEILEFASEHWHKHDNHTERWNGRQIRNAFTTAAALAHFEAKKEPGKSVQLRAENFRKVEAAMLAYERYRASILNGNDGELARQNEARNDEFDEHANYHDRGGQARGHRAAQAAAKYDQQDSANPSTPIRKQEHFGQHHPHISPQHSPANQYSHSTAEVGEFGAAYGGSYALPSQAQDLERYPQRGHPSRPTESAYSGPQPSAFTHGHTSSGQPSSHAQSPSTGRGHSLTTVDYRPSQVPHGPLQQADSLAREPQYPGPHNRGTTFGR